MIRLPAHTAVYRLRAHLRRGGVVAYPTESSYGLGCLPGHSRGLRRLIRLKKRPQSKGLISIGGDWAQLSPLLRPQNAATKQILLQHWPAPKTYLLCARAGIPAALRGKGRSKLAVRIPDHAGARALCKRIGTALVSTSCNRAGKRACRSEREARRQFGRDVWVIGGRTGCRRAPSTIIDWESGRVLR
ncbi:L-threonylcarbamoyladenylate synthase [Uruburuella testudinis]|uniref:Threonylcarbamoyl-AMP synthase n=1 Tax=Uruburuella testudinis TaxID=1282863 RepID=A0ABY4DW83_9NEIS|nr:L-threonylcarbamoyladenylate synthase [Uruburuella testudinis]UOO83298.1 L-threonylcarbamoyladenylate synthase [Uruburuella testudinis]